MKSFRNKTRWMDWLAAFAVGVWLVAETLDAANPGAKDVESETNVNVLPFPRVGAKTPNVDGRVSNGEYGGRFSGLIDMKTQNNYARDANLYTACDGENLYVGAKVQLPEGKTVQMTPAERDDPKLQGKIDAFVLMIRSDDDPANQRFTGHYLAVGAKGVFFDGLRTLDWNGGACRVDPKVDFADQVASEVEDDAWTVEVRLPMKKLGLSTDKPFLVSCGFNMRSLGVKLSMNLHPIWWDHFRAFSLAKITDLSIAVDNGDLVRGLVEPDVTLTNGSKRDMKGTIGALVAIPRIVETIKDFDFDVKIGQEFNAEVVGRVRQWSEPYDLPSGATTRFHERHELKNADSYLLLTTVTADDDVVYRQLLTFTSLPPLAVDLTPVPSQNEIDVSAAVNGPDVGDGGGLELEFRDLDGKTVKKEKVGIHSGKQVVTISMSDLKPGEYAVTARVVNKKGTELATVAKTFEKWKEPEWLENPVGLEALSDDWVPRLFEPVTVDGDKVSVWGREFDFGGKTLIPKIVSQGELIVDGGDVTYRTGGRDFTIKIENVEVEKLGEGRAVARFTGSSEHFKLNATQTIDFDGMDLVSLDIQPVGDPVDVDFMRLDVKLKDLDYFMAAPRWTVGVIEDMDFGKSNFNVFFANDRVGLDWLVENWKGWVINSAKPRMRLKTGEDEDVYEMLLVNEPSKVDRNMKLRFALHPTPVKPQPKGWRDWRFEGIAWCGARAKLEVDGEKIDVPLQSHWMVSPSRWAVNWGTGVPRENAIKDMAAFAEENGQKAYPFICTCRINPNMFWNPKAPFNAKGPGAENTTKDPEQYPDVEEVNYFFKDWSTVPTRGMGGNYFTSPSSSYTDFFIYWMRKFARDGAHGIYMDLNGANENFDERKKLAYKTKDGVLEGTKEFLALRDYYKRVYWVFEQERGADNEPCMLGHACAVAPVYQSLWSLMFGGEGFKPADRYVYSDWYKQTKLHAPGERVSLSEPDAERNYDAIVYRMLYPGRQTGIPQMILPQYSKGMAEPELKKEMGRDPLLVRELMAFSFPHNHFIWPAWVHNPTIYDFWKKVEIPYGMGDAEFHSYRENDVKTDADNVKASYWSKKDDDDYLVAVANWAKEDAKARVTLPSAIAKLRAGSDMETGETVELDDDGVLELTIPKLNLKVLRFRRSRGGGETK